MQYGSKVNRKQNNACIVARNNIQLNNGGNKMKFILNSNLYSIGYNGKNKVATCNGYKIPIKSYKKARRIYFNIKKGR
jgi:hypothetical protein